MIVSVDQVRQSQLDWRIRIAHYLRVKDARAVSPAFVARELLYYVLLQNPQLCDAVPVVTIRGGLGDLIEASASLPLPGRRIVRLLYRWSDIDPHLWRTPSDLSTTVLAEMAQPGNVLRARIRQAQYGQA